MLNSPLSRIRLSIGQQKFDGLALQGQEAISEPTSWRISLLANEATIELRKRVQVELLSETGYTRSFSGQISAIEEGSENNLAAITLTLNSAWAQLRDEIGTRFFVNRDVLSIATEILAHVGYTANDIKIVTHTNYLARPFTQQLPTESSLHFLQRILAQEGISLVTSWDDEANEILYFIDDFTGFCQISNTHLALKNILHLTQSNIAIPSSTFAHSTHFETKPQLIMQAHYRNSNVAIRHEFGHAGADLENTQRFARLQHERLQTTSDLVNANTDEIRLQAGQHLNVESSFCGGDYVISAMKYSVNQTRVQSGQGEHAVYRNALTLLSSRYTFRPALPKALSYPASTSARIENSERSAPLNQNGEMPVRFHHDISDSSYGAGSPPLRRLQAHGGEPDHPESTGSHGFHTPLEDATDVIIAYINNDPDRPFIVGSIAHANTTLPVASQNASQHILRSSSGHELLFDDFAIAPQIQFKTSLGLNLLHMQEGAIVATNLQTQQGNMLLKAKQSINLSSGKNFTETQGKDRTQISGQDFNRSISNASVEHTDGEQFHQATNINHNTKNLSITSAEQLNITSQHNTRYLTQNGMSMIADKNSINVTAGENIIITGSGHGNIDIGQHGGGLTIDPQGNIKFYGKNTIALRASGNIRLNGNVPIKDEYCPMPEMKKIETKELKKSLQTIEKTFPEISLNLADVPIASTTIMQYGYYLQITTKLSGNVNAKKQGDPPIGEISLEGYKTEARSKLSDFFAEVHLKRFSTQNITVGGNFLNDLNSNQTIIEAPNRYRFIISPQSLEKVFKNWQIDGNVGFDIEITISNHPSEAEEIWYQKAWNEIIASAKQANPYLINLALALMVSQILLEVLIIAK